MSRGSDGRGRGTFKVIEQPPSGGCFGCGAWNMGVVRTTDLFKNTTATFKYESTIT